MKKTSNILARSARFARETAAAVGLASVLLGSAVFMTVGAISDLVWVSHQKNMLEAAIDAGGIAAFKEMSTLSPAATDEESQQQNDQLKATIKRYVLANVPQAYRADLSKSLTIDLHRGTKQKEESVTVEVAAKLPGSILGQSWGLDLGEQEVNTRLQVKRSLVPVDIVVALSGSTEMRSSISQANKHYVHFEQNPDSRLVAAKNAASTLVSALFLAGGEEHVSVGFVPYTAVVNVGKNRSGWVDDIGKEPDKATPPNFSPWEGCVLHRADHLSLATPAQAKFPSYFHPKTRTHWMAEEDWLGLEGPQLYCIRTPITPLSNDESSIQQTIADLALWENTGNMTHLGVQWGRRVLAPDWRVSWGGEEPEGDRKKVLVLLTDGTNNVGAKSYSAYGQPGAGISGMGTQRANERRVKLDQATRDHCDLARSEGIHVYGVLAVPNDHSRREAIFDLLRDCTGSADRVFRTGSPAKLTEAFLKIGKAVGEIRRARPSG